MKKRDWWCRSLGIVVWCSMISRLIDLLLCPKISQVQEGRTGFELCFRTAMASDDWKSG